MVYESDSIGSYKLKETISVSHNSLIRRGVDTHTNKDVVVKIFRKTPDRLLYLRQIVDILQECTACEYITKLIEAFTTEQHVVFVHAAIPGAIDVHDFMQEKPLAEDTAWSIFKQLMKAVHFMHEKNMCHLDLKAENLLMDSQGKVHLIDFEFSSFCASNQTRFLGTPAYLCPDRSQRRRYDGKKSDVWSAGVILYMLLTADMPYDEKDTEFACSVQQPRIVSDSAFSLIESMLKRQAQRRLSSGAVLAHEWLKDAE